MSAPLVTVLMPVYNAARHVDAAITGILAQTEANFEFLIIDDGSSDGSVARIEAHRDPRIRLVCRPQNGGIVAALNHGLSVARGRYLARMDADDVALPERLAVQIGQLEAHPDWGLCGSDFIPLNESELSVASWVRHFDPAEVAVACLFTNPICHPTVTFRRDALPPAGYSANFPHAEDLALWIELSHQTKIANLPEQLLRYRVHPDQISRRENPTQSRATERLFRQQLRRLDIDPQEDEMIAHRVLGGAFVPHPRLNHLTATWCERVVIANRRAQVWSVDALDRQLQERRSAALDFHARTLRAMPPWRRWRWQAPYRLRSLMHR